jgi:hypothetical protein
VILLRRRPGARSRLEPVDPLAAWDAWDDWLAGGASRESEVPGYEERTRALLNGQPVYRLELGDDLDGALDLLEPLL